MLELLSVWGVVWVLGLVGVVFVSVQDWRTTFVSDWVVYMLLGAGIVFRVLEGVGGDWSFLLQGFFAFCMLGLVGVVSYYGKIFAGGDVWLLLALAWYVPGTMFDDLVSSLLLFGAGLLGGGFVYLLGWTFFFSYTCPRAWWREVHKQTVFGRIGVWSIVGLLFGGAFFLSLFWWMVLAGVSIVMFLLVVHTRAVERGCLHVMRKPGQLLEGDWLLASVRVGKRVIPVRTGGLTREDIRVLRRAQKSVMITQGVPFVPVIAFGYVLMVFGVVFGFDVLGWMGALFF